MYECDGGFFTLVFRALFFDLRVHLVVFRVHFLVLMAHFINVLLQIISLGLPSHIGPCVGFSARRRMLATYPGTSPWFCHLFFCRGPWHRETLVTLIDFDLRCTIVNLSLWSGSNAVLAATIEAYQIGILIACPSFDKEDRKQLPRELHCLSSCLIPHAQKSSQIMRHSLSLGLPSSGRKTFKGWLWNVLLSHPWQRVENPRASFGRACSKHIVAL